MDGVARTLKNTAALAASAISVSLFGLLATVATGRYLGPEILGKYTVAITFFMFASVVVEFGMRDLVIREVAKAPSEKSRYLSNMVLARLALASVAWLAVFLFVWLGGMSLATTSATLVACLSLFPFSVWSSLAAIYNAFQRMEYEALLAVVTGASRLVLILIVLSLGHGLMSLTSAFSISHLLALIAGAIVYFKTVGRASVDVDFGFLRRLFERSLPFAAISMATVIYARVDFVILSYVRGDVEVGLYSASRQIVDTLLILASSFSGALFPLMSRQYAISRESLMAASSIACKCLLTLSLPIALATTILADRFVLLLLGEEFVPSAVALQILIWSTIFSFVNAVLGKVVFAAGQERAFVAVVATTLVVTLVFDLLLVPRLGYLGAAIVTVLRYGVSFCLHWALVKRYVCTLDLPRLGAKPLVSTLVMGGYILLLSKTNFLLLVSSAIIVYLLTLMLLKSFARTELRYLRELPSAAGDSHES